MAMEELNSQSKGFFFSVGNPALKFFSNSVAAVQNWVVIN